MSSGLNFERSECEFGRALALVLKGYTGAGLVNLVRVPKFILVKGVTLR